MRILTAYGATKTLKEWSKIVGVHITTLDSRIRLGWTPEDTLTLPVDKRLGQTKRKQITRKGSLITAFGTSKSANEWEALTGIKAATIQSRIRDYKMAPEIALTSRRKLKCLPEKRTGSLINS